MNNNAMFLHNNEIDRAVISSSTAAATMPVTHLQNQQRTVMWRSVGAGNQTIDITLALGEEQVQAFALVDHNLSLSGTVQIEAWSDGLGGAVKVFDMTLQPYQPVYGYGGIGYGLAGYGGYDASIAAIVDARAVLRPILAGRIEPSQDARYWRITLNDPSLSYYQMGRLYLGSTWQPETNFAWGSVQTPEGRTRRLESRGGQYYGNPRNDRALIEFNFDWLNNADRDRLKIISTVLGEHTPFIFVQYPVGGYEQESSSFYCLFDPFTLRRAFLNNAAALIKLRESL